MYNAASVQSQIERYHQLSQANPMNSQELFLNKSLYLGSPSSKFKQRECVIYSKRAECPNANTCNYAHGQLELTSPADLSQEEALAWFKLRYCRDFNNGYCAKGNLCIFRHRTKNFAQIFRRFYTPKLFTLESLYASR